MWNKKKCLLNVCVVYLLCCFVEGNSLKIGVKEILGMCKYNRVICFWKLGNCVF